MKQSFGIPIGGNCSSPLADLTLAYKEFIYMKKLLKEKFNLTRLLSNNSRYVDDINIINYKTFMSIVKDIYPPDLKIERSGENDKNINYLDVNVLINEEGVITNVYNKVDSFDFPVISYTYTSGNIPLDLGYNVFYGQILRYCRICSTRKHFMGRVKHLFHTFQERGYRNTKLLQYFRIFFVKNHFYLFKFGYEGVLPLICDLGHT